jgi:hypothetical protein
MARWYNTMARKTKTTISLWAVIEGMQKRLEAEGLDRDVVDAAVARGIEALLTLPEPREVMPRKKKNRALWLRPRAVAKA